MSQFTTPAKLEMLDNFQWRILEKFEYRVGSLSGPSIIVPEGFITDLATIPRVFWTIFPPHGEYAKAAIIHDYMYSRGTNNRKYADDVLMEAMGVLNVPTWRKKVIYWAVRIFGKNRYKGEK